MWTAQARTYLYTNEMRMRSHHGFPKTFTCIKCTDKEDFFQLTNGEHGFFGHPVVVIAATQRSVSLLTLGIIIIQVLIVLLSKNLIRRGVLALQLGGSWMPSYLHSIPSDRFPE